MVFVRILTLNSILSFIAIATKILRLNQNHDQNLNQNHKPNLGLRVILSILGHNISTTRSPSINWQSIFNSPKDNYGKLKYFMMRYKRRKCTALIQFFACIFNAANHGFRTAWKNTDFLHLNDFRKMIKYFKKIKVDLRVPINFCDGPCPNTKENRFVQNESELVVQ